MLCFNVHPSRDTFPLSAVSRTGVTQGGNVPTQLTDGGRLTFVVRDRLRGVEARELAGQPSVIVNLPVHAVCHHITERQSQKLGQGQNEFPASMLSTQV